MKSFFDIVETIKDVVSAEFPNKKVFDKDVADLLDISQMNFATMKKRNKIPFNELLDFCAKRSIAINWLLYNQSPESLIEPTNRFYRVPYFSSVNASAGGGHAMRSLNPIRCCWKRPLLPLWVVRKSYVISKRSMFREIRWNPLLEIMILFF